MSHEWVCVPNHYNAFPVFIQRSVDGRLYSWSGPGDLASDGEKLLSSLPEKPVGLIGYSYGGLVAWWLSLIAPHRVRELIILGSIPDPKYIPRRLRWMCRLVPPVMMLWWREMDVLSRLYSVCRDFPVDSPKVSTLWLLGKADPFHRWEEREIPNWSQVRFVFHDGGAHPTEQEWSRFQKFS